nr:prolyl oligopeptidase family serine peptidase [Ornithinicoccus halotolerans]
MTTEGPRSTVFHDLDRYVAHPRLAGLAISPDGTRLVTTVATMSRKGDGYATAVWGLDPTGERPAHRITRSARGESGAAFNARGDLYFTSARPDPDRDDDQPSVALWQKPAEGGEARVVLTRPGGVGRVQCARDADVTVVTAPVLAGATDETSHAALHKVRKEGHVDAILHEGYPVRFWDHDLGPAAPQLHVAERDEESLPPHPTTVDYRPPVRLRSVTPDVGATLAAQQTQLAPDGSFALVQLSQPVGRAERREVLARVDLATGTRQVLLDEDGVDFAPGPVSPDSGRAIIIEERQSTPDRATRPQLMVLDLATGERTALAPDWDRWPHAKAWSPDGATVYCVADDQGRCPVFAVDVATGDVRQLTRDDAAYSELVLSPDGRTGYGVRSSYQYPAEVVRIDLGSGEVTALPGPVSRPELPGRLEEVETITADGTPVRGWLALPHREVVDADGPVPMLLWIHGGPLGSWNAWTWRWNPWLMVAQGYAVLLPDPALSTGYGQDFIERGWGRWGAEPYTDLMAITDSAVARPDIDETRTAAMGGSFGGYMANWVAGHTDRFQAIVTHASLWALDQFGPTTDAAFYWAREMTEEMALAHSPHRFVEQIVTPMLVIHGDKDYRVPIGEGLRLWYDLLSRSGLPADEQGRAAHRFLYFPHENHWILAPQHAKVWYQVVSGFLAEHVLGQQAPQLPQVLGRTPATPEQLEEAAEEQQEARAATEQDESAAAD